MMTGGGFRKQRDGAGSRGVAPGMIERVVQINHVAKVVKGGRRFGFSTIVVVGDGAGSVGVAIGKAKEVPESITKGRTRAMKTMIKIKTVNGTIPHEIMGRCGATRVLLRPAVPGTGIIAGKSVRAILESSGIRDILSKTIGSSNAVNVVKATMDGLVRLQTPEEIAEMRGRTVGEIFIAKRTRRLPRPDEESSDQLQASESASSGQAHGSGRRKESRPSHGHADRTGGRSRPRTSQPSSSSTGSDFRRSSERRVERKPRPDPAPGGPPASSTPAS